MKVACIYKSSTWYITTDHILKPVLLIETQQRHSNGIKESTSIPKS